MATQDLAAGIAFDALRARVPVDDMSIRIEHINGVVRDSVDQQLKTTFRVLELHHTGCKLPGALRGALLQCLVQNLQFPLCFPARRNL